MQTARARLGSGPGLGPSFPPRTRICQWGLLGLLALLALAVPLPHDEGIVSDMVVIKNSPPAIAVLVVESVGWIAAAATGEARPPGGVPSEHPNGVLPLLPGASFGQRQARALWEAVKSAWERVTGRKRAPADTSRALCKRPDTRVSVAEVRGQCPVGAAPHPAGLVPGHAIN